MSGLERRRTIRRLAATQGNLYTRELAEYFSVSRMTIHRDLQVLEEAGNLNLFHGGATLNAPSIQSIPLEFCNTCKESVLPHQRYLRKKADQSKEVYCCALCGLRSQLQQASTDHDYATDMISGKTLPAEEAFFLIRSSVTPCCQPSILTFTDEAEVISFHASFGGVLCRINEALDFLQIELSLKKP